MAQQRHTLSRPDRPQWWYAVHALEITGSGIHLEFRTLGEPYTMHTLYDSDTFSVTHLAAIEPDEVLTSLGDTDTAAERPVLLRHGFEIVDKRSGKELYLDGSWAELFQQRIAAWQVNAPTEEEVEDTLAQYAELAQTPLTIH